MQQPRPDPRFPADLAVVPHLGPLERDLAAQFRVGAPPHHPHTALTERFVQAITASDKVAAPHRRSVRAGFPAAGWSRLDVVAMTPLVPRSAQSVGFHPARVMTVLASVRHPLPERGVPVTATLHADKFAAYLRMLKDRSGQGYERLGRLAGASGSSLHRYCSGKSVPTDYRVVHSFAKVCGASAEELRELHQLWALADAGRVEAGRADGTPPEAEAPKRPDETAVAAQGLDEAAAPDHAAVADDAAVAPRRWRLRPWYAAVAIVVVLLLAGGLVWAATTRSGSAAGPDADRMLFSPPASRR
ncbi:hypothetical protein GCM10029964_081860 [Kibdelosporangium lantanae]